MILRTQKSTQDGIIPFRAFATDLCTTVAAIFGKTHKTSEVGSDSLTDFTVKANSYRVIGTRKGDYLEWAKPVDVA
ncbi:MAG: hypothetical protein ACTHM6_18405, partial [Tepidisphaeraceae bacterium]